MTTLMSSALRNNRISTQKNPKFSPTPQKLIIGHTTPDADAVCSAIGYAFLKNAKGQLDYSPAVAGTLNRETKFILNRFNVPAPQKVLTITTQRVILVDHNSQTQSPKGVTEDNIIKILDHHKVVGKSFLVNLKTKRIGSTSTLIGKKMMKRNVQNRSIAGILLSAIISDTLGFVSSTTTDTDRKVAKWLADTHNIDMAELQQAVLDIKTDINGMDPGYIITMDSKSIACDSKRFFIGQIFITKNEQIDEILKEKILTEIEKMQESNDYDGTVLMISNIRSLHSKLLVSKNIEEFFKKALAKKFVKDPNGIEINGIMRKKMTPLLEEYQKNLST